MKKKWIRILPALILLGLVVWTLWGNTALEITEYEIVSDRIPQGFSGFRIAQISDLHNAEFGEGNCRLIELLAHIEPDIIVITGDMIDSRHTDMEIALAFARQAVAIAPVYYVSGNHEARIGEYGNLKKRLTDAGVVVLENQKVLLTRGGDSIALLGIDDPSFRPGAEASVSASALAELQIGSDSYNVLLAHRPELFSVYAESGIDLVFSGHAHGGQFRLPFFGGLVAPNQGLFPRYDAGMFASDSTTMIVSRGIGNSIIPVRFNNRPEVTVATLECGYAAGG